MTNEFAAALSEHPLATEAVGEVVGEVLEAIGEAPDLALLFVSTPHLGAIDDIAHVICETLQPLTLLGCTAESIVGNRREVEGTPAIALWAGRIGPVVPFHLKVEEAPDGPVVSGWPEKDVDDASALLLFADPFSFPVDSLLTRMTEDRPGLPLIGGLASAARGPGGNRLVVDRQVISHGAVGAFCGPDVDVITVVSQGCRPVGNPLVVTRAEHNIVYELAGQPALLRLEELVNRASDQERQLMAQGLHLGQVIDEHKATFGRGDFLVRNVLGADPSTGAIAVGDICDVGSIVQFHVRDGRTADEDLRELLSDATADGALLFTCNGRGTHLFTTPDHDARVVSAALDNAPLAGFFAAGEIGPVGGRNFLHGFTASVAMFRRRS